MLTDKYDVLTDLLVFSRADIMYVLSLLMNTEFLLFMNNRNLPYDCIKDTSNKNKQYITCIAENFPLLTKENSNSQFLYFKGTIVLDS